MTHWSRPSKWFLWRTGLCNTWFYTALISSSTVMTWHTYWITHRCTILYVCNMCFSDPDAAICHLCMYVCLWFVTFVCDINMMCVHVYERDGEVVCVRVCMWVMENPNWIIYPEKARPTEIIQRTGKWHSMMFWKYAAQNLLFWHQCAREAVNLRVSWMDGFVLLIPLGKNTLIHLFLRICSPEASPVKLAVCFRNDLWPPCLQVSTKLDRHANTEPYK